MKQLNKIIITPFFGELPPWFDKFKENVRQTLLAQGYVWFYPNDLNEFNDKCVQKLGFKSPIVPGEGKLWDYRPALGLIYEDSIKEYDYWLTMDFDMCFGNVGRWFPDNELEWLSVWSNHHAYVNGCWTYYKNSKEVNELFMQFPDWKEILLYPKPTGWAEMEYSRLLENSGLNYKYSFHQGWPYTTTPNLRFENGELYQDGEPIAMFHFRRSKIWPL